jgi:hypothetical protein
MGGRVSTVGEVGWSFARVGDGCGRISVSIDDCGAAGDMGRAGECGIVRVTDWVVGEMTTEGVSLDVMRKPSLVLAPLKTWSIDHFRVRAWPYPMWCPRRCLWE